MAGSWFDALADEAANGVSATAAVGAVLGGVAGAAVAGASVAARMADAAGGGGSWSFDKDEIDAVIKDWKALAEELEADRDAFQSIATVNSPSSDQPSVDFMANLISALGSLEQANRSMWEYVNEFIEKLEEAKRATGQVDTDSADVFRGQ